MMWSLTRNGNGEIEEGTTRTNTEQITTDHPHEHNTIIVWPRAAVRIESVPFRTGAKPDRTESVRLVGSTEFIELGSAWNGSSRLDGSGNAPQPTHLGL